MAIAQLALVLSLPFDIVVLAACQGADFATTGPEATQALIEYVRQLNTTNREALFQLHNWLQTELTKPAPDKRVHRGFKELQRLTEDWLACADPAQRTEVSTAWRETAAAIANLKRLPMPEKVDFFQTPWFFIKRLNHPVGRGRTPSSDVPTPDKADPSRIDPLPSTFWQRPKDIPAKNLYYGFDRTNLLLPDGALCTYAGPKESFGRNPGFSVDFQGTRLKLKFAEVSSEPFAARMFCALGYFADPTDYAPGVRLSYSRAMLREFNSRKSLATRFTFLGFVPLFTLRLQKHYDPFDYVARAILTNGTIWTGTELKRQLFLEPARPQPEADPLNFNARVESTIAYLEMVPASVQTRTGKSTGH